MNWLRTIYFQSQYQLVYQWEGKKQCFNRDILYKVFQINNPVKTNFHWENYKNIKLRGHLLTGWFLEFVFREWLNLNCGMGKVLRKWNMRIVFT
jgi:hypothetical protein